MVEATRPLIMRLEDLPRDVLMLVRDEFLHEDDRVAFESTSKALHDLGGRGRERPSVTPDKKERLRRLARDPRAPRLTLPWFQWAFRSGENDLESRFLFTTLAAAQGNLDALLFLRRKGCPFDDEAYECAARFGHQDVLRVLWAKGCRPKSYAQKS